jgi:lysine-N-methylase
LKGQRLAELFTILVAGLDSEVIKDPAALPPPSWIGRILFRQALALYSRKDQGPKRGMARSRLTLLRAAYRFARGTGPVPRLHTWIPETTFEQAETSTGSLPADAEAVLERYYTTKVSSLQFCGPAFFGFPLWEGMEALAVTFPVVLWIARTITDRPRAEAIARALTIADDHFGFNRMLATLRQRFSFHVLARTGELDRLIAWYSR